MSLGKPSHLDADAVLEERVHVVFVARRDLVQDSHPVATVGDQARREAVAEGNVHHRIGTVGEAVGLADVLNVGLERVVEAAWVGLLGDVSDRATEIALAVQRTLRPFQDLDAFHVEQRAEGMGQPTGIAVRHRQVVRVDADHGAAARRRRQPRTDNVL